MDDWYQVTSEKETSGPDGENPAHDYSALRPWQNALETFGCCLWLGQETGHSKVLIVLLSLGRRRRAPPCE